MNIKFKFELINKETAAVEKEKMNVVTTEDLKSYLKKNKFKLVDIGIYETSDNKNIKRVTVLTNRGAY